MEKAKKLVDSQFSKKVALGINSIVHVFFLAIYQNDYNYAISFLAKNKRIHKTLFNNLFVIIEYLLIILNKPPLLPNKNFPQKNPKKGVGRGCENTKTRHSNLLSTIEF